MGTPLPAVSEAGAEQRLLEASYIAHLGPMRTWPFYALTVLLCAALWGITFLPAVERAFGVSPAEMAGVALALALAIGAATACANLPAGLLGTPHRIADRGESAALAGCGALLIYLSGSAASVFWLIPTLLVLTNSRELLNARFLRWSHAIALGFTAALFAAGGKTGDAAMVAFFAAVLFLLGRAQARSSWQMLQLQLERDALSRQVEALIVEQERERIARDLHDGVGAHLAALAWSAEELTSDPVLSGAGLGEISSRARAGLAELRAVVGGLKSQPQRAAELAASIERDGRRFVPSGCQFDVTLDGDASLSGEQCLQLGLMIREAARNAIQHGRATHVAVAIRCGEQLMVEVRDDGHGAAPEALARSTGGVAHLRERAARMGGALDIDSSSGGTRVTIRVPRSS